MRNQGEISKGIVQKISSHLVEETPPRSMKATRENNFEEEVRRKGRHSAFPPSVNILMLNPLIFMFFA